MADTTRQKKTSKSKSKSKSRNTNEVNKHILDPWNSVLKLRPRHNTLLKILPSNSEGNAFVRAVLRSLSSNFEGNAFKNRRPPMETKNALRIWRFCLCSKSCLHDAFKNQQCRNCPCRFILIDKRGLLSTSHEAPDLHLRTCKMCLNYPRHIDTVNKLYKNLFFSSNIAEIREIRMSFIID